MASLYLQIAVDVKTMEPVTNDMESWCRSRNLTIIRNPLDRGIVHTNATGKCYKISLFIGDSDRSDFVSMDSFLNAMQLLAKHFEFCDIAKTLQTDLYSVQKNLHILQDTLHGINNITDYPSGCFSKNA